MGVKKINFSKSAPYRQTFLYLGFSAMRNTNPKEFLTSLPRQRIDPPIIYMGWGKGRRSAQMVDVLGEKEPLGRGFKVKVKHITAEL
jgi:hypothetical protein